MDTRSRGREVLDVAVLLGDPDIRRRAWQERLRHPAWTAEPNAGTRPLVGLERQGRLRALLTQKIDGLHQRAGLSPDLVLELHGRVHEVACPFCGERTTMRSALDRVEAGEADPACLSCGGILKSATVSFGQALDAAVLDAAATAAGDCDAFLAVGTSLTVRLPAGLTDLAAGAGARSSWSTPAHALRRHRRPVRLGVDREVATPAAGSADLRPGRRRRGSCRTRTVDTVTAVTSKAVAAQIRLPAATDPGAGMRVPLTTRDFLDRAELVYGDRVGVVDEVVQPAPSLGEVGYRALARRGRALQAGLDALGVGEGERIAIVSHNSARLLELLLAVPSSGRIAVPVNFRLQPEEVGYIVGHSGARVLLVDPELEATLTRVDAEHRFTTGKEYEQLLRYDVEPRPWSEPDENATATINYTSGTTARPKGVQMTHRNIWVNSVTFGMHMQVGDRDVYLHTLPLFHCNGWGLPYTMAGVGARQVVLRKVDGAEILRRVQQHGVTIMAGAPAVWNAVLAAAGQWDGEIPGRGRVRIVVAGAPPPSRIIARVETELGWEFNQIYGLTETAPLLTVNRPRAEYDALDPEERARLLSRAGVPALGTRLRISESGEVLARGNTVLAGYWQDPDGSAEALEGGWFHTGDGGTIDEGGYLTISDRKKDVIITGGENVSSIEVEDVLFSHPAVAEVAVIGVPDDEWGEMVTALVVVTAGAQVTEQEIIAHCRARMAGYKTPKRVEFRETIPRTATGKIQKFKLREAFWPASDRQVN